jgi:hypothetical protein
MPHLFAAGSNFKGNPDFQRNPVPGQVGAGNPPFLNFQKTYMKA